MNVTLWGPALFVADIPRSRAFYEGTLGFTPVMDNGPHVAYPGFALWQAAMATGLIGPAAHGTPGAPAFELSFEAPDIEGAWQEATANGAAVVNELAEQPWGQRVFRLADPDGHLLEFGEPLPAVVRRFADEGLAVDEICARTHMPEAMVTAMLA